MTRPARATRHRFGWPARNAPAPFDPPSRPRRRFRRAAVALLAAIIAAGGASLLGAAPAFATSQAWLGFTSQIESLPASGSYPHGVPGFPSTVVLNQP